ncbi:MAG: hypothetical protein CSA68_06315 [Rhodobacterales bacterium]|nr:MAG: hypothetical protein CSA68_06315 [Rhodobacterales bacterium]
MQFSAKYITAGLIAMATSATAYEADPAPSLLELFSPDKISTVVAHSLIAALRTQVEMRYDYLSSSVMQGGVSITGLQMRPRLPYDTRHLCVIKVDRATLSSALPEVLQTRHNTRLTLTGLHLPASCVPSEAAQTMRTAGLDDVQLDYANIRFSYTYGSGEISSDMSLAINDFAHLDLGVTATMVPTHRNFYSDDPDLRFTRLVATLKDNGGWARVQKLLPPKMQDPKTIRQIVHQGLSEELVDKHDPLLQAPQRKFINELADQVEAFTTKPGEITIEAVLPPEGVQIDPNRFWPNMLITTFGLTARSAPLARTRLIDNELVNQLSTPDQVDAPTRLKLAQALLAGIGVPQAPAMVPELLEPLLDDITHRPQAAALIARSLQDTNPEEAYPYALMAGAGKATMAGLSLDRIESMLTTGKVMKLQEGYKRPPLTEDLPSGNDPRALRDKSLAYFTGLGAPRSYARAYYFALLAQAAGDVGAAGLLDDIKARFAGRGEKVRKNWTKLHRKIEGQALEDWFELKLAERYQQP